MFLEADRNRDGRFESMQGDTVRRGSRMRVRVNGAPGSYVRIVTDGGRAAGRPVLVRSARFRHRFRLRGNVTWARAEVYGEDLPDARHQGCESVFGGDGAFSETYCTNRVAMQALSSAIYLR